MYEYIIYITAAGKIKWCWSISFDFFHNHDFHVNVFSDIWLVKVAKPFHFLSGCLMMMICRNFVEKSSDILQCNVTTRYSCNKKVQHYKSVRTWQASRLFPGTCFHGSDKEKVPSLDCLVFSGWGGNCSTGGRERGGKHCGPFALPEILGMASDFLCPRCIKIKIALFLEHWLCVVKE